MASKDNEVQIVYSGHHLSMAKRGRWEYATRNTQRPAVGIVAITDERKVVVVEQFRSPVDQSVIELPAGLAGDIAGAQDEPLVEAAKRELLEETGYMAKNWTELGRGFSSPGLTDESIALFLATGLVKTGPGGGDATENIVIREIALDEFNHWVGVNRSSVDLKLMAGLYLAQRTQEPLEKK